MSGRRNNQRLDYQELSTSGKRVYLNNTKEVDINDQNLEHQVDVNNIQEISQVDELNQLSNLVNDWSLKDEESVQQAMADATQKLIIKEKVLGYQITDVMHESGITDDNCSSEEIKEAIQKMQCKRDEYREIHTEMEFVVEGYHEAYDKKVNCMMESVQDFILTAKKLKRKMDLQVSEETIQQDEVNARILEFQINEVTRMIEELEEVFNDDVKSKSDVEVKRMREELLSKSKAVKTIGEKIEELMKTGSLKRKDIITQLNKRYEHIIVLRNEYCDKVKAEMDEREVDKLEAFQVSSLNIKLSKYKGYGSSTDIYTFQNLFEKLHLKNTPHKYLADLLKNNYLDSPALSLVRNVDSINEIWKRLKDAYGDCKTMLDMKLADINKIDGLWKLKEPIKVAESLAKLINIMKDLMRLAEKHGIQEKLYYGDGIQRIYKLIGDKRLTRWISQTCDNTKDGEELWLQLVEFLERDQKVNQQKALLQGGNLGKRLGGGSHEQGGNLEKRFSGGSHEQGGNLEKRFSGGSHERKSNGGIYERRSGGGTNRHFYTDDRDADTDDSICAICGEKDHVATNGPAGTKLIQYFTCRKFVEMSPAERFRELLRKRLCFQCLYPGAKQHTGKHKFGNCQHDFICRNPMHNRYERKMHVLVCEEHKAENEDLLKLYKTKCITRQTVQLPPYAKEIQLSHFSIAAYKTDVSEQIDNAESGIYMLQTIQVDGEAFTLFFDSGCKDFVARHDAIERLGKRARKEFDGPIQLGGVGGITTESRYGVYSVKLPLANKNDALMTGVCLPQITQEFPHYPLNGKVECDIRNAYSQAGRDVSQLPKLPRSVGGNVDFMLGVKYLRYFPEIIFQLKSGLSMYKSHFSNSDGSRGVIGGPHNIFTCIERDHHLCKDSQSNFVQSQSTAYKSDGCNFQDLPLLEFKGNENNFDVDTNLRYTTDHPHPQVLLNKRMKLFEKVEEAGTELNYRCMQCRDCQSCKNHATDEMMSIREEVEQHQIEKSVSIDLENRTTVARLPFIHEPLSKLCPNKNRAMKVFLQQLRKLGKALKDKDDVVQSEGKLQNLGHVEYVKDLPQEIQKSLSENPVQNYIPWRAVWKVNSLSTPCRMVFDASQPTKTGYSLNDLLAKGRNNMNKLLEVFIRWRIHKYGFHTDVRKMYNSVKLNPTDWCFQRYLWKKDLKDDNPTEEKVIKTLIYGVRSSGNQAECGIRRTASMSKVEYPEVCEIILRDVYVDDCLSGEANKELALERADQLELVLNRGGFALKGVTLTGMSPSTDLSSDGISISVAGLLWQSQEDTFSLDVKELNFSKKHRGRKVDFIPDIPERLTRRQCTAKVAEIFDLSGMFTPIVSVMKMDLHELVVKKLDWDDEVPQEMRHIWIDHFQTMTEINCIKLPRAVVPVDAVSTDVDLLSFGDASKNAICVAIYARFARKNGLFSCQLIFGRSKLVPKDLSQPRAELFAALVNCHSTEIVKRAFYKKFKQATYFTDSQIVLHWLNNKDRTLKQWVRGRVVEIHRFTIIDDWNYVASENMIADIGTRRGVVVSDVNEYSAWFNGFPWMSYDKSQFPSKKVADIKLSKEQLDDARKESPPELMDLTYLQTSLPDELTLRYQFSNYVIDPNKFNFRTVVRVLAYVMKFVKNLQSCLKKNGVDVKKVNKIKKINLSEILLNDDDVKAAEMYYFKKATSEIKHFLKPHQYEKFSNEKDGILYYTGRILPSDEITVIGQMTKAMKDLCQVSFCVPVLEKYSPVAYSIINEVHWHDKTVKHKGVESLWRNVLKIAFVIEGRQIVKKIKVSCKLCRFLEKRKIDVAMGPVSRYNLSIAPAFYHSQVDLCGPFTAYSQHHKRSTVKIWLVVFCCATTSATSIKVMDSYSTTSFIQAFIRFSCCFGYPKVLLSDEGSQLVKAFNTMELNFIDIKQRLHREVSVKFELCPVGGHNMNGKVERKIREVKSSLDKSLLGNRLSILQWETIASEIGNSINNLPLALGNYVSDFESLDLLTPNRLLLGRNNDRCPDSSMIVTSDPERIFKANQSIFNSWFENWLLNHVPKLMSHPKWFKSDEDIKVGDVILFLKHESSLKSKYQFGMVESIYVGKDGKIRKVQIKYRNHNENISRTTFRAVRELVMIHHVDEVDIFTDFNQKQC